ncbi:MAG: AAA family ATPase [Oscillatoriales cyanobacterium SM2_1_8]|nr:AAA family ATPase [Oscillatoriales cyanobacterium SM2_1_8]
MLQAFAQGRVWAQNRAIAQDDLLQTHISYVVLAGDWAYKLKKSVNFGFLDFSTLAQRQHFCHEELRLNRRLAADLYVGVVPIFQEGDRYFLGEGPGEPVEYAVKMHRFHQEDLFLAWFEAGKVTAAHMVDIADRLAEFHRTAATDARIAQFGTAAALQAVADDNYQATAGYVGRAQTADQLAATKAVTDRMFAAQAARFAERVQRGQIRECHGDVHLKNICWFGGQIQIFDCIEFNEPFRFGDVLYDAAFLAMDLDFRGRPDLANVFLNRYLEVTGDYEGVPLLPLFLSMRAYVRAKVTSFLLDDPNVDAATRTHAQQEAAAYYRMAATYLQPQPPRVHAMVGLSGAGKSTTAAALAAQIGAIVLRSDVIRKHLAGLPLLARGGDDLYTPEMTARTYQRLAELTQQLTEAGWSVVVDAKYDRVSWRQGLTAALAGIPLTFWHCQAPSAVLAHRLQARAIAGTDVADATADLLAAQQAAFEPFAAHETAPRHVLDTAQPLDLVLAQMAALD